MNSYDENEMKEKVTKIAKEISDEFRLGLTGLEFYSTADRFGECDPRKRFIYLQLRYPDGELMPEIEIWRTLAHELSHLRILGHGPELFELAKILLEAISARLGRRIRPEIAIHYAGGKYLVVR